MTRHLLINSDKGYDNLKTAFFYLTPKGRETAEKIQSLIGGEIVPKEHFKECVQKYFHVYDALIFIMAAGIVVRTIAPFLDKKSTDPAVIVIDQNCEFIISLLSGHLGGANDLTRDIALKTGACSVITTATDVQGVISFDEFAKRNNLYIENLNYLKYISGALLEGKKIDVVSDRSIICQKDYPQINFSDKIKGDIGVVITDRVYNIASKKVLVLRPKSLVVGTGCKKNINSEYYEKCFLKFLDEYGYSMNSVESIATISLKKDESAFRNFCRKYNKNLVIVSDDEIKNCDYQFEVSEFVQKITGLPAVSESCGYIASGYGEILTGKVKYDGITFALCRKKLMPYNM
jgi:cobalt-precorrin 5A hydrolase